MVATTVRPVAASFDSFSTTAYAVSLSKPDVGSGTPAHTADEGNGQEDLGREIVCVLVFCLCLSGGVEQEICITNLLGVGVWKKHKCGHKVT